MNQQNTKRVREYRVIKFRAWDKKNECWIPENQYCGVDNGGNVIYVDGYPAEVDDLIPQQFTGLKDKNGKEIYCSDFVGVSKDKYGEVYWNKDELAWWVEPIGEYPCEPLRGKGSAIEILGNKYEGLA